VGGDCIVTAPDGVADVDVVPILIEPVAAAAVLATMVKLLAAVEPLAKVGALKEVVTAGAALQAGAAVAPPEVRTDPVATSAR
jgi:hypothetical protein